MGGKGSTGVKGYDELCYQFSVKYQAPPTVEPIVYYMILFYMILCYLHRILCYFMILHYKIL